MTLDQALLYAMRKDATVSFFTLASNENTMFISAFKGVERVNSMIDFKEIEQNRPITIAELVVDVVDHL